MLDNNATIGVLHYYPLIYNQKLLIQMQTHKGGDNMPLAVDSVDEAEGGGVVATDIDGQTKPRPRMGRRKSINKGFARFQADDKKQFRKGLRKFLAMLVMFVLLLVVLYIEQDPVKYFGSHSALLEVLEIDTADNVQSADLFWRWFTLIHKNIAGSSFDAAEKVCHAERIQTVEVNGVEIELADPRVNFQSCIDKLDFIPGANDPVVLSGNHHLLTFGIFTRRSPQVAVENKLYNDASTEVRPDGIELFVRGNTQYNLSPGQDVKIIDICDIDTQTDDTATGISICVLRDGFQGAKGSTLQWAGMNLQGEKAFDINSTARIYFGVGFDSPQSFNSIAPCYSFKGDANTGYTLIPGPEEYNDIAIQDFKLSNCRYTWVSSAVDIAGECALINRTQPETALAYGVGLFGYDNIYSFISDAINCDNINNQTYDQLTDIYIEASYPLDKYLPDKDVYGTFIPAEAPTLWLGYGAAIKALLETHSFIDASTGDMVIYAVSRNLSPDALFYTFINLKFTQNNNGEVVFDYSIDFFPILHYVYAFEGYEWRDSGVLILECMLMFGYVVVLYFLCVSTFFKVKKSILHLKWNQKNDRPVSGESRSLNTRTRSLRFGNEVSASSTGNSDGDVAMVQLHPIKADYYQHANSTNNFNNTSFHRLSSRQKVTADYPEDNNIIGGSSDGRGSRNDNDNGNSSGSESAFYDAVEPTDTYIANLSKTNVTPRRPSSLKSVGSSKDASNTGSNTYSKENSSNLHTAHVVDAGRPVTELIMDWLTAVALGALIYGRYLYVHMLRDMHTFISEIKSDRYDDNLEEITDSFGQLDTLKSTQQMATIVVVVFFIYQFFIYTAFHPRVGVVMNTIRTAAYHLLPLLSIFLFIVVVYAILGTQLYGLKIKTWESPVTAISELFLFILGEFDTYGKMDSFYPAETTLFFWSFIVIGFFLMFNMVLAVILFVYEKVQDKAIEKRNMKKMKRQ